MKLAKPLIWAGFMALVGLWGCDTGAPNEQPQGQPMENSGTSDGSENEGSDMKPAEGSQAK